jgi:CPA1 family monovalent cation:H+ antiporter
MNFFNILSILLTLSALFAYINHRYFGLPSCIGLMFIALLMSLGLISLSHLGVALNDSAKTMLHSIDFNQTLLHGVLGFMLYAGAMHIDLNELRRGKWAIGLLATVSVLISTFVVALLMTLVFNLMRLPIPFINCLLFGALISPTDPIAVLGILKSAGTSKSMEIKIAGESLFNDGVGVVIFVILLEVAAGGESVTASDVVLLFLKEAGGGAVFGLLAGLIAYAMLKSVDNYNVEILITLALVAGGYALADALHISGPIAVVVAGLLIGNHGRAFAMSETTREHLDTFWELTDEILNTVLFVLIGLEVMVLHFTLNFLIVGLLAIPTVLFARLVSVSVPLSFMRYFGDPLPHAIKTLTWGGLRGGISIALALSLPAGPSRELIVSATYIVAVFSILVQGLTLGSLVRKWENTGVATIPRS